MNKDINEQIKVMQHFADGGEVEWAFKDGDKWHDGDGPVWDWVTYDYRIKKEPKTRPLTFDELIPLVGTPVRIDVVDWHTYTALSLRTIADCHQFWNGEAWCDFLAFHELVTRLDGTPFTILGY